MKPDSGPTPTNGCMNSCTNGGQNVPRCRRTSLNKSGNESEPVNHTARVPDHMRRYLNIVKALASDKRLRMLMALRNGELCEGALAELVGVRPATASRHLWVLMNAGLLDSEKRGRCVCYHLAIAREESLVRETLDWVRASLRGDPQMTQDATRLTTLAARSPVPALRRLRHGKQKMKSGNSLCGSFA
jgi:DNA-binding transcriptional ArsR family regulator